MKMKENNEEEIFSNEKVYEIGYLLLPNLTEEEALAFSSNLKDSILKYNATYIASEMPKNIDLAYTIIKKINNKNTKFDNAYFAWIKFEMEAEDILKLKKELDKDTNILRFLIIKTVKENTLAPKKLTSKEGGGKRKVFVAKKEEEEKLPIDEDEIDSEIEKILNDENSNL